ncbi:MAG: ABC transporter ATP-binding protein, partial [Pseudomonadota bacterium]
YPLIGIPITAIGRAIRRVARRVQGQIGDLTGTLTESLSSPEMIKSYRLEERERQRMDNAFEERRQLLMKLIRRQTLNEPAITVIVSFSIAVIIAVAAFRIDRGLMTSADLAAFLVAIAMLSQPARGLGNLNAQLQEGLSVMERAFSVTDVEPRVVDQPGAASFPASANKSAPSIHLDHVSFSYDDHRAVLRDVSLEIPGGSTTALVGPSGAGKSTIFGLLPRFFDCDQGSILINGRPHTSILLSELRGAMSIVSQTPVLFDISLAENIALGAPGADHEMIVAAAKAAAAHDFIEALPQGYDTQAGPGGGQLSGGERQRIALARAFLKDAPILLLDEATSALDAQSESLIEEAMGRLRQGRTTLVIAHRLSTIRDADLIAVIDGGQVVDTGSHDELVARKGLYAQLVHLQERRATTA